MGSGAGKKDEGGRMKDELGIKQLTIHLSSFRPHPFILFPTSILISHFAFDNEAGYAQKGLTVW